MRHDIDDLFRDLVSLNDRMNRVDIEDPLQIIRFCEEAIECLTGYGLICWAYDAYKSDWEAFNTSSVWDLTEKSLSELCTYLLIYQRQEHMSGDYGGCYVNAFKSGLIPALICEIVRKTERMARSVEDSVDKNGRIGIAGEYFVAAELTRRGYVASLTSKNTKAMDLLVSDKLGRRQVAVQVKTCDDPKRSKWKMSDSVEKTDSPNLFFVFVNMNGGKEPSYYVVPSKYVAYRVREDYENWLNAPAKSGCSHRKTTMRTFEFLNEEERRQYEEAWHLLGV